MCNWFLDEVCGVSQAMMCGTSLVSHRHSFRQLVRTALPYGRAESRCSGAADPAAVFELIER